MKITLLPSCVSASADGARQFSTSFLINDTVAIDAGSLGFFRTPDEQARVRNVLLSHTHIDHIASLPIFVENIFGHPDGAVTIHGSAPVLDCLRQDVFNDRVWPDFVQLSQQGKPFLQLNQLADRQPIVIEGLRITPVRVDHVVPTDGFIIEDDRAAIVISSDTGPTEEIWRLANALPNLKAAFVEVTFPNAFAELALLTKHHTPLSFLQETRKLRPAVSFLAYHIKARFMDQVIQELHGLGMSNLIVAQFDVVYSF